jgi:hypothetical protein
MKRYHSGRSWGRFLCRTGEEISSSISCLRQIACPNSVQPRPQYEHCLGELRPNARTTMSSDSVGGTHMAFELVAERESETAPGLVLSNHESLFRE